MLPLLRGHEHELAIAAVNSPTSLVLSGATAALRAVTDRLREQGVRTSRLAVSHAFHSPLMEPMLEEFGRVLAGLAANPPEVPIVSNLSGLPAAPHEFTRPSTGPGRCGNPSGSPPA